MNGNPNAAQKRYHNDLRLMHFDTIGGVGELHHIFGSKEKFKLLKEAGIERPGEWFVILLPRQVHLDIKSYSFEAERGMFLQQLRDYEAYFGNPAPVPAEVIRYYKTMLSRQYRLKSWPIDA